jgi:hypothetical protein
MISIGPSRIHQPARRATDTGVSFTRRRNLAPEPVRVEELDSMTNKHMNSFVQWKRTWTWEEGRKVNAYLGRTSGYVGSACNLGSCG